MASNSRIKLIDRALTASVNGDVFDLPDSAKKFIAWLNVSANDGATTVSAKIQHSPDKVNWIDVVSFANVVNTTGVEAKHEASFVVANQGLFPNVRCVVTLAGTPSATVEVSLWFDPDRG